MQHHAFNIGKPHIDAWWSRNKQLGIITAGYGGIPGDRGEVLLKQMTEGDWILAFSSGHGFVGAGAVGPQSSYRLLTDTELPVGWEAKHRHIRQVNWIHTVASLVQAVPASEVGRKSPRQTKELLPETVGTSLVEILAKKAHLALAHTTSSEFVRAFEEQVERSSKDTVEARLQRLKQAPKLPTKTCILRYEFVRNPDVVAQVLHYATSCGECKLPAPFMRRSDGTPYFEVHHRTPLAKNGEDTVENAVALCPNCHRKLHYGQDTD